MSDAVQTRYGEACNFAIASRRQRFDMACKAVRACRAKWLADYLKAHNPTGKPLSEFTGDELAALWTAATRDAPMDDYASVAAFDPERVAAEQAELRAFRQSAGLPLVELRDRWRGHFGDANRSGPTDQETALHSGLADGIGRRIADTLADDLAGLAAKLDVFFACHREDSQIADLLVPSIMKDTRQLLPAV